MEVELIGGPADGTRILVAQAVNLIDVPIFLGDVLPVTDQEKQEARAQLRKATYRRDEDNAVRFNFDGYK
jgi:hypothetical protein